MTFGKRLKNLIKERGLTQTRLAELTGFRQSDISDWVNDLRAPRPETLQRLAETLGVQPAQLLNDLPQELSAVDLKLFSLPPSDKQLALDFLDFIHSRKKGD